MHTQVSIKTKLMPAVPKLRGGYGTLLLWWWGSAIPEWKAKKVREWSH